MAGTHSPRVDFPENDKHGERLAPTGHDGFFGIDV
jgi:hypothetical protein